ARAALRLAGHCRRVVLLPGASRRSGVPAETEARRAAAPNLSVRAGVEVVEVVGVERVEALLLRDRRGRTAVRAAAALFVAGGRPRTAWLDGTLALHANGVPSTGPGRTADAESSLVRGAYPLETSVPGVFAAGAVRGCGCGVAESVEEGIAAARQAEAYLRGLAAGVEALASAPGAEGRP
ncbi:MAG TPA: hypothetical protein VHG93_16560, partial [Longimicrobium sp.]|nr:hypothetical protein [Longimicrobium sp.]